MSYKIIKQRGWYNVETDGVRAYQWSSEVAIFHIEGDISEFRMLLITIGSDRPNRIVKIVYSDESTFEFFIKSGWREYIVPLRNSRDISICTDALVIKDDNRSLGIQVSDIVLCSGELEIFSWTINNVKSKWVDITYSLHASQRSEIKIKFKNTENKFFVIEGDRCLLSFELNDVDIENNNVLFEILQKKSDDIIIHSIVNRIDYYDYLGLKSSKYYDDESRKNEMECTVVSEDLPLSFQWFVNWRCNFQCSYCWQTVSKEIYRNTEANKIPWQKWIEIFNHYKPSEIAITGGEPTLYSDLPEVINGLDPSINLLMTTNAGPSFDLEKWKRIVKRSRIWDMFFSFHPTQWKDVNDFYNKIDDYISFYKPGYCGVEMVESPQNLEIISVDDLKKWCADRRINCKIDLYYPPIKYISLSDKIEPTEKVNLAIANLKFGKYIPERLSVLQNNIVYCPSGWRKINLDYKGNVFTCMSAVDRGKLFGESALPHYNCMGNIFNKNFQLRNKPILCWESYRCSRCDSHKIEPLWRPFSKSFNGHLPLPN